MGCVIGVGFPVGLRDPFAIILISPIASAITVIRFAPFFEKYRSDRVLINLMVLDVIYIYLVAVGYLLGSL